MRPNETNSTIFERERDACLGCFLAPRDCGAEVVDTAEATITVQVTGEPTHVEAVLSRRAASAAASAAAKPAE